MLHFINCSMERAKVEVSVLVIDTTTTSQKSNPYCIVFNYLVSPITANCYSASLACGVNPSRLSLIPKINFLHFLYFICTHKSPPLYLFYCLISHPHFLYFICTYSCITTTLSVLLSYPMPLCSMGFRYVTHHHLK